MAREEILNRRERSGCDDRSTYSHEGKTDKKILNVGIILFENHSKDRPAILAKGSDCILFLKNYGNRDKSSWGSADMWFGIQPRLPAMERSLARLSGPAKKR